MLADSNADRRRHTRRKSMGDQTKYLLDESRIPKRWYNIQADLPKPLAPVLHPGTMQPIGPDDLAPLFPMELILQEVSTEREIDIPEPCARSIGCGGRVRCSVRIDSRRPSARRRRSSTSTRA